MSSRVIHRGAIATAVAITAVAGTAGAASAATVHGMVIHHNRRAHSFVVADAAGRLYAFHAARAPRIGSEVVVVGSRLRDGSYRLQHEKVVRQTSHRVRVRGVVSWVDQRTGSFVVSAAGASVLVVHHNGMRAHSSGSGTGTTTPTVGSIVLTSGTVNGQGEITDDSVQSVGQDTGGISLEGTILAIDPVAQTITVSADDSEQSGSSITVSVPSTFSITQFAVGEEVELKVQLTGTGTATLLGSADDGNAQLANSSSDSQGQNAGSGDGTDQPDSQTQTTPSGSGDGSSSSDGSGQTTTTQTTTTQTSTTPSGGDN